MQPCPCSARRAVATCRIIAFMTDTSTVRDILAHLGNPADRANVPVVGTATTARGRSAVGRSANGWEER
jgi:hypothetical protein